MVPEYYPASNRAIEIGLKGSAFSDVEQNFWQMELTQLRRQLVSLIKPGLAAGEVYHLSVFALAPIPLLIELGRLLSDIPTANVYQLHREPVDWKWRNEPTQFAFQVHRPTDISSKQVALALALSGDIHLDRIQKVLGRDVAVWTVTYRAPANDFLQSSVQLKEFWQTMRGVFNQIKIIHGDDCNLHLLHAILDAVAAAV